jgi:hypothetical protein
MAIQPSQLEIDNIVAASGLRLSNPTVPASSTDTGTQGDISWDSNYLYVCTSGDTWKRAALSTWSELPVTANLELWLDANDSSTITLNGSTVSQWDDKSGNDYHVSQGTASNQPTLTSSVLNSKNVLRFDGGDWLENLVATPVGGSTNRTIFIVANYTGSSIDYLFYLGTASNSPSFGSVFGISQETAVRVSNGNRIWATSVGSDHMILTISLDGTNITDVSAWQNGTALTISSTLGTQTINTSSRFYVGGPTATVGNLLEGDIAEVIVYSSALSTSDRESVESYLSNKWGIT